MDTKTIKELRKIKVALQNILKNENISIGIGNEIINIYTKTDKTKEKIQKVIPKKYADKIEYIVLPEIKPRNG